MKLVARIIKNAIRNRLQLNDRKSTTFNTLATARKGSRIPSILQCTLPQDLPLMKQPSPTQATEKVHRLPSCVTDSTGA